MLSRREFLIMSAGTALVASFPTLANTGAKPQNATAVTQVFGDGVRLTAIAIGLKQKISALKDVRLLTCLLAIQPV